MMRYPLSDNTNVVVRGAASAKVDNQSTTGTGKVGTFLARQFKGSAFSSFFYDSEQHSNQRTTTLGNDDGEDGKPDSSSVNSSDEPSRYSEPSNDSTRDEESFSESNCGNCNEDVGSDTAASFSSTDDSLLVSEDDVDDDVDDDGNEFSYGNGGEGLSAADSLSGISIVGGNDDVLEEASPDSLGGYAGDRSLLSGSNQSLFVSNSGDDNMSPMPTFESDMLQAIDEATNHLLSLPEEASPDPKSLGDNTGDKSLLSGSNQSLFVSNSSDDMPSMPTFERDMLQAIDEATNHLLSFSFTDDLGELGGSTNDGSQELEIVHISDEAPACSATDQSLPAPKPIQISTCLQKMETESLYEDNKENIPKYNEGTSSCQDERIAYLEAKLAEAHLENECTKEQLEASNERIDAANTLDAQREESIAYLEAQLHASEKENADLKDSLTKTNLDYECLKKNVCTVADQLRVANKVGLQRKRLMAGLEAKLGATEKDKADLKASLVEAQLDNERKNDTNLEDRLDAALSLTASLKTKLGAANQEAASMKEQLDEGNTRKESFSCLKAKLDVMTDDWARQDRMIFSLGEQLEQSELEKEESREQLLNVKGENILYEWDITALKRELAISSSTRARDDWAHQDMIFTLTTKLEQSELEKEESRDQLLNVKGENRLYEWDITTLKRELAISSSSRASYQIALEENVELVMRLKKEREELKQQLSKAKAEAERTSSVWERLTCV